MLLETFSKGEFPTTYIPTVFDNTTKDHTFTFDGEETTVQFDLWDTAGQEEMNRVLPLSYRGAGVIILTFSVMNPESFESIKNRWYPEVKHHRRKPGSTTFNDEDPGHNGKIILCGTESHLREDQNALRKLAEDGKKPVSKKEIDDFVNHTLLPQLRRTQNYVPYIECSAPRMINVNEVFEAGLELSVNIHYLNIMQHICIANGIISMKYEIYHINTKYMLCYIHHGVIRLFLKGFKKFNGDENNKNKGHETSLPRFKLPTFNKDKNSKTEQNLKEERSPLLDLSDVSSLMKYGDELFTDVELNDDILTQLQRNSNSTNKTGKAKSGKKTSNRLKRCKKSIEMSWKVFRRTLSFVDLFTDARLLFLISDDSIENESNNNNLNLSIQILTVSLFLSVVAPYILSYSCGLKLFFIRQNKNVIKEYVGFKKFLFYFHVSPFAIIFYVFLDIIDILFVYYKWFQVVIMGQPEEKLKILEENLTQQMGMSRMDYEGIKRQRTVGQLS